MKRYFEEGLDVVFPKTGTKVKLKCYDSDGFWIVTHRGEDMLANEVHLEIDEAAWVARLDIEPQAREYFNTCVAYAKKHECWEGRHGLGTQLRYLATMANKVRLYKDFAPYSFGFSVLKITPDKSPEVIISGGLIFHGIHDGGGSGSAPTFAVSLTPVDGWSIHT